ncbi:hypothetical protein ACX3O0_12865 [Homoserinimonas sp. A447]
MGISRDKQNLVLRASLCLLLLSGVMWGGAGCTTQASIEHNKFGIPELSADEADRLVEIQLESRRADLLSRFPDAVLGEIERIRFVTPEEWPEAIAECLTGMGFEATASADGGIEMSYANEQAEPAELAHYTCGAKYPVHPKYSQPLNEAQLEYLYDYYVNVLSPCLEGEDVSVADAPSLSSFLEADDAERWFPYNSVDRFSPKLEEKCPQSPSGLHG